jgi:hypothetical protein
MSPIRAGSRRAEEASFSCLASWTAVLTTSVEPSGLFEFGALSIWAQAQAFTTTRKTTHKMAAAFFLIETPKKYKNKRKKTKVRINLFFNS